MNSMAEPVTDQTQQMLILGGVLRLDATMIETLGGNGAWIQAEVVDGTLVLRRSPLLDPATVAAVLALELDTDEN